MIDLNDLIASTLSSTIDPLTREASPLTADVVRAAMERMADASVRPHMHVVHPRERDAEWARCADCFQVISPRALREDARRRHPAGRALRVVGGGGA